MSACGTRKKAKKGSCRIIRRYEQVTGGKAYALLDNALKQSAMVRQLYQQQTKEFATESTIKAILTGITYAKNQMLTTQELSQVEIEGVDFPALYEAYNQLLQSQQLMDYDDQMVYARTILRRYPAILRDLQERYRYFCVDEAQDTSKIQHEIVKLLASKTRNLFLVGDEDQSIYSFRAAYPQALMEFEHTYPGAQVRLLERNYRSTVEIVDTAQKFISKNLYRHPKHMESTGRRGAKVQEVVVDNRQKQYQYLVQVAATCPHDTAVLYRDNDSALPLIDLLERRGIPYQCRQVDCSFFTSRVVNDVTNLVRFAQDSENGTLFLELYYKLGAGISKAAATEASQQAYQYGMTPLEYLSQRAGVSNWTRGQCRRLQGEFDRLLSLPAAQAISHMVEQMGYGAYLESRGGDTRKTEILQALGYHEPNVQSLLTRLDTLNRIMRQGGEGDQGIILSTIHSSKGLEYPRVILMDVIDGVLPKVVGTGAMATPEDVMTYQEERRLFYVGMTRAKEELQIISFRSFSLPSTFSQEIFPKTPANPTRTYQGLHSPPPNQVKIAEMGAKMLPGVAVSHKSYGTGRVVQREGDYVTIAFARGEERRFSLSTALSAKQLTLDPSV